MYFKKLNLYKFRNYETLNVSFIPQVNVFVGQNGQGKTNLLEAVFMAASGESFRPGQTDTFIKKNDYEPTNVSLIKTEIFANNLEYQVKLKFENQRKKFEVNEKPVTSAKLKQSFPVVLFSPESLSVIKDGPEQRRQLLNQFLVSHNPYNAKLIREYTKSLKSKNKVIKEFKSEKITKLNAVRLLESLDGPFLKNATELTWARISALRGILTDFSEAMKFISGSQNVDISVDYLISETSHLHLEKDQIFDLFQQKLTEYRERELLSGNALVGPHKHDIQFLFEGQDSRYFCSQGQQRALILSFKMAQIMYHRRVLKEDPVLLLDDVLSELDQQKQKHLLEFLKGIESQIFITTTDLSFSADFEKKVSVFEVENGRIKENL